MRKINYVLLLLLLFTGCKNNEPELTECQKENVGYFAFDNNSDDPYDIFINNTYYRQQPGNSISSKWIKYPAGKSYTIKVQQASGYLFTPTVKTYNITLNQCDEKTVSFP